MIISKEQIVVIIYLIIRDDVYLLPPGPALVTFPDICITKPSDKGSTSLWGVVLIKCVENLSQLHSSPINKIYNKIQIIHQSWRVLTAGTSRRNIVNTWLPIVSLQYNQRKGSTYPTKSGQSRQSTALHCGENKT